MIQKHVELGRRIRNRLQISPLILTLFRMRGGGEGGRGAKSSPPTSFSAVTSTNIEIRPQKLFDF